MSEPINPVYVAQLVRDAKGSGVRFALAVGAALAVIIGAALILSACSVTLYAREWPASMSQSECDALPETMARDVPACARYEWAP